MEKNRDQVSAVVCLAQGVGAESVKFNILKPSPQGDKIREEEETLTLTEILEIGR